MEKLCSRVFAKSPSSNFMPHDHLLKMKCHKKCFPLLVESPHLRQARSFCKLPQIAAQPLPERV